LLERLETRTVVVTGFATDICVLFTANDAYMRGFDVVVPRDCVASERGADNDHALRHMTRLLKAEVIASDRLDFQRLGRVSGGGREAFAAGSYDPSPATEALGRSTSRRSVAK
jgi:Isochorismatase family